MEVLYKFKFKIVSMIFENLIIFNTSLFIKEIEFPSLDTSNKLKQSYEENCNFFSHESEN